MFHPKGPTFWEQVRQGLSSTERGYDLLAPKFEFTPYRTPDWVLEACASSIGPTDHGLDLCCGTGAALRMLLPLCRHSLTGIDFSQGMLDEAKRLLSDEEGSEKLKFVRGDVREMPFPQQFDLAVCFGALGHLVGEDESLFLKEVYRVLQPGGRFVFVTSYSPKVSSRTFWLCHGFNLAMRVRNCIVRPRFIMYYLTFLLPEIQANLKAHGFEVEIRSPDSLRGYSLVIATRSDG